MKKEDFMDDIYIMDKVYLEKYKKIKENSDKNTKSKIY